MSTENENIENEPAEKLSTIVISYGEIALKKGRRHLFEKKLLENLKIQLKGTRCKTFHIMRGRIKIHLHKEANSEDVALKASKVFGVVSVQNTRSIPTDWDSIQETFKEEAKQHPFQSTKKSFAVRVNRPYKQFPYNSYHIGRELGGVILEQCPEWHVDLTNPEVEFLIELHQNETFIASKKIRGPGGLPVGVSGKVALLLSGGIDSPVAGYMMQKRGATLIGIYFHSHPYTGDQALNKVIDLAKVLRANQNHMTLYKVHLTQIQEAIRDKCDPKYAVILTRRMMMRLANFYAWRKRVKGIVTGDSLGQVASQTLDNMAVISEVCKFPIYRPLIGMDKVDIMDISRAMGTYNISIRPYEDCCSLFVDENPITDAHLKKVEELETLLNIDDLIYEAIGKSERIEY